MMFKITGKILVCIYLQRVYLKKKRSVKDLFDDVYAIFFLIFLIKAYVVGTHLNCQMRTHNICLYKEVDKKHTDCYLRLWNCLTVCL